MLACFNVQKTHYFLITVHYCRSSMSRLSQTLRFLQSPSFRQAQSVLIGQLTQRIVIGQTPQAGVGNVTPLSIIVSFGFQVSFINSSPRGEQSRVTDTVMMLVCICTQSAIKTADSTVMWPCLSLSHIHTQDTQNFTFKQSIANTWTNNKTYSQSLIQKLQIVIAKSEFTPFYFKEIDFVHSQTCTLLGSRNCRPKNALHKFEHLGCAVRL